MHKFLAATAGLIAMATSASAADYSRPYAKAAPMMAMPAAYDWSGFYIGGQVGYAGSSANYAFSQPLRFENLSFDPSSVIGGGHVGLQGQWGSWVLGVEGAYNYVDLKQTDISVLIPNARRSINTRDIATVVGKVGYSAGQWLFYGKGGYADADISTSSFNPANGVNSAVNNRQSGYTVGGGIDYMFARNWIAGVDFNYYDFRFNRNTISSNGRPFNYTGKDEIYAGMFRLSYLFNWGGSARY